MQPSLNPTALWILLLAGGLSMATLLYLFQKHISGQPLLRYEPRRRVPWGGWAVVVVILFLLERLQTAIWVSENQASDTLDPTDFVLNGWLNIGLSLALTAIGLGALIVVSQADRCDLGLPASWGQFLTDLRIGLVACLAALAPVYLIQLAMQFAIQPESHHPLLEQLQKTPTTQVLLTALGAAVLAAPIFEEFLFRLLLQGALERLEDQWTSFSETERTPLPDQVSEQVSEQGANIDPPTAHRFENVKVDNESTNFDNPFASPHVDHVSKTPASDDELLTSRTAPRQGMLPGLPHGWAPMLTSGLLFALAHVGHGADPIPLLLLGTVLGYLYQRTHRLVPSIAAHMFFNTFSLCLAWLQLGSA